MLNKTVDAVSSKEIENRIRDLAQSYLPELSKNGEISAETVITRLFAELEAENISLLPKMRDRINTLFLNMYGLNKKPASPSHGYVIVTPTVASPITIRTGTRVGSEDGTVFTLREPLTAVRAEITDVFSTDEEKIVRQEKLKFFDYSGDNLEDVFIAFSSESILKGADSFEAALYDTSRPDQNRVLPPLILGANADWYVATEHGDREITELKQTRGKATLRLKEEVPVTKINGVNGRWIKLRIRGGMLPRVITPEIISLSAKTEKCRPDALCFNDSVLSDTDMYPFERQPSEYDCFYIKSDGCFSKRGSKVTVKLNYNMEEFAYENGVEHEVNWKTVMPGEVFRDKPTLEKYIEEVVFEYWNGKGWTRLFKDNSNSSCFADKAGVETTISFTCPADIEETFVAADNGLFIRCRVTRITPGYRPNTAYIVPFIRSIEMGYDYGELTTAADSIFLGKNAEITEISGSLTVTSLTDSDKFYSYICIDAEPATGTFNLLPIIDTPCSLHKTPTLELLSGTAANPKWYKINAIDLSEGFTRNEPITLFFDRLPVRARFLGKEGCWLRAGFDKRPEAFSLSKLYFNAAKIMQYEEMQPEYYQPGRYTGSYSFFIHKSGIYNAEIQVLRSDEWVPLEQTQYSIDRSTGKVTLADGWIPPISDEPTIRAVYSTTEGSAGNLPEGAIISLLDPVPFVDEISNPEMTYGGNDIETDAECLERGRDYVKTLGRCISAADYETAALGADKLLARASCRERDGYLELILLPGRASENAFELIRENVINAILPSMPFYLCEKLRITRARYAEIYVSARVAVNEVSSPAVVTDAIERSLIHYLDSIVGGRAGNGWEIGEIPTENDIKAVILSVGGVRTLKGVNIECELDGKSVSLENLKNLGDIVPAGTRPRIIIVT